MGEHQGSLEVLQILRGDARLRQQAKTGVNAVGGTPFGNNGIDAADAVIYRLFRTAIEAQDQRLTVNFTKLSQSELTGNKIKCMHINGAPGLP